MNDNLDKVHFDDLAACDPSDVENRTNARFDPVNRGYEITVWNHTYRVDPGNRTVQAESGTMPAFQDYMSLVVLHYLLTAKKTEPVGTWVSEKDITGGAAFFRGPHLVPSHLMVKTFGDDLSAFKMACERLDGKLLDLADAAFSFEITPKIPVAVLYWQGDEDFSSEAKLLFDQTIEQHLALDIIYALAVEVCAAVAAQG